MVQSHSEIVVTILGFLKLLGFGSLRSAFFKHLLRPSPEPTPPKDGSANAHNFCVFPSGSPITVAARKAVGLLESEIQSKPIIGTLLEVNAVKLTSGRFNMEVTSVQAEHLTFGGSGNSPILRILSIDSALELYQLDVTEVSR